MLTANIMDAERNFNIGNTAKTFDIFFVNGSIDKLDKLDRFATAKG